MFQGRVREFQGRVGARIRQARNISGKGCGQILAKIKIDTVQAPSDILSHRF